MYIWIAFIHIHTNLHKHVHFFSNCPHTPPPLVFPLLASSLQRCWSSDSQTLYVATSWRSQGAVLCVDMVSGAGMWRDTGVWC